MSARLNAEQREAGRGQLQRVRRAAFYVKRIQATPSAAEKLRQAWDYLRAVAEELPDAEVLVLAKAVAKLADERNGS